MSILKEYTELKDKVEKAQQEVSKAEGALEQIKTRLKKEHDCSTVKEAKKLLKSLIEKQEDTELEFSEAVTEFEEKWEEQK